MVKQIVKLMLFETLLLIVGQSSKLFDVFVVKLIFRNFVLLDF